MGKHELLTTTASARHIGKVTAASTGGATLGAALAQISVWYAAQHGVDMSSIEGSLTVVATVVTGALGGFLVRPETKEAADDATN
jgi:hypothetical protein